MLQKRKKVVHLSNKTIEKQKQMKTLTLEQLAEKLNGKLWEKGDLKRIYLDKGYNTKKMSTKTWVEQQGNIFIVKCFIDCPSQNYNWIKSQQQEVIDSVEKEIEQLIAQQNVKMIDYKINDEEISVEVLVSINESEAKWMQRDDFYEVFGIDAYSLFGGELEIKINELYDKAKKERQAKKEIEEKEIAKQKKAEIEKYAISVDAKRVRHPKFGLASVIEINNEKGQIKLRFDDENIGIKTLLTRFAGLEFLD